MRRRDFITLVGGAAAWPIAARAQRGGVRWIGVLLIWNDDQLGRRLTALFEQSLGELGWTVGRNLAIDYRYLSDFRVIAARVCFLRTATQRKTEMTTALNINATVEAAGFIADASCYLEMASVLTK